MNPWEMDWSGAGMPAGGHVQRLLGDQPRATTYSPRRGGDQMEGGYASSRPGPDGQAMVRTLEDFRTGQAPYVTVAGNPSLYGRQYTIPEVSYRAGGKTHTLRDVPVVVHDTGSAFRNAPEGRFDVPVGRDLNNAETNQGLSGVQFMPSSQPMAFSGQQPRPAGVQAIDHAIRPVPGADPIPAPPWQDGAVQQMPAPPVGQQSAGKLPWEMHWSGATPQQPQASSSGPMPWEMNWSGPEAGQQPAQPTPSGLWNNITAGANDMIYSTLGAPVDAATWVLNQAAKQARAISGAPVRDIENPIGGSRSIAGAFEGVGVNDPAKVQANSTEERLARAAGVGIGSMVAPEAALAAAGRVGVVSPKVMGTFGALLGRSNSAGELAANAGIGAAAGATGEAVASGLPEKYRPLGETVGNLLGGGLGVGALATGRAAGEAVRAGANWLSPITRAGQERAAGAALRDAASDPNALRESLSAASSELIPGSRPTTFQATGDMGLGGLERAVATKNPEAFSQRRAEQNAARVGALEGVQPNGAPEQVVQALRRSLSELDRVTAQTEDAAASRARSSLANLGGEATPEGYGASIRQSITDARAVAKERESALWEAVDPDGTLALPATETARVARQVKDTMPVSAKPMNGEEAAAFSTARAYGTGVVPLSELTALRSRLSEAMRGERRERGQTRALARMTQLRAAVERDLETAVLHQAEREAQGVASGSVALEDTLFGRMQAVAGGSGDWPGPNPAPRASAASTAPAAPSRPDAVLAEAADIAAGRRAPYRPPSFLRWVAARGGIRPDPNVTAALEAADRRAGGILNSTGRSLDDWGVAMAERGGMQERPDERQMLDWVSEAANGRDPDWWVAVHADPGREEAARIAESIARLAAEQGINLRSRKAALDLLQQEMALYGDAPTSSVRANLSKRIQGANAAGATSPSPAWAGTDGRGMGAGPGGGAPFGSARATGGGAGAAGEGRPGGRGSGGAPGGEGVSPFGLVAPNFDEAALDRLRAAGSTTQERRRLFDQGPVGDATRSAGAAGEFRLPSSAVPQRFFVPGARGFEAMQALRTAAPEAMGQVRDYALATLRRDAMRMDGTLDPAKVQTWRRKYGDALRAIPEVDRMLADPVQASEAFAQVAAQRKAQMDAFQEGAVSRLLGLDDPADVTKTIGGIFSRQDQVKQMARLVRETAGNEEARQGLRKAVADYVNTRFISNTEAGTSGVDQIRSDQFQQFLKQSAPALRTLFSGDEMKTLYAIAADLKRSNRSVSAVKLPGASNTAQDTAALAKADQQPSVLSRALTAGGAALAGTAAGGPWGAIAAAMGTEAVQTLRNAGLRNVDDLVRDAMLNPALARVLLAKAPAAGGSQMNRALLQRMLAAALTRPAIGAGVQGGAAGER